MVFPMYIPTGAMRFAAKVLTQLNKLCRLLLLYQCNYRQSGITSSTEVTSNIDIIVNPAAFEPETVNVPPTIVCPKLEVPAVNAPPFVLII